MWINPNTGRGWTDEEERAFARIMATGQMERMSAIRLYRRCRGNLAKALKYATESAFAKEAARNRFKGGFHRQNRSLANAQPNIEANHVQPA